MADLKSILTKLYGSDENTVNRQTARYTEIINKFHGKFKTDNFKIISTPGRTEISGNHTDHNNGKVIASGINLDAVAVASKNDEDIIRFFSEGYDKPFAIDLRNLAPLEKEKHTTGSLLRGVSSTFESRGYDIGGFNAFVTSDVIVGFGLSSSATIEILIASILNSLYNNSSINNEEIAKIGQIAENSFFGKPCGLMDQLTCSIGGLLSIDFAVQESPVIEKFDFDLKNTGYSLLIVNTGESHFDLTIEYSSIPNEMKKVAKMLGKGSARELTYEDIFDNMNELRREAGDRAIVRIFHYIEENKRVDLQTAALKENRFDDFLKLVNESGDSSFKYLQNIFSTKNLRKQSITLALALSSMFINKTGKGACRVHGGGFAGSIQVFIPSETVEDYKSFIKSAFGENAVTEVSLRKYGTVCLNDNVLE